MTGVLGELNSITEIMDVTEAILQGSDFRTQRRPLLKVLANHC